MEHKLGKHTGKLELPKSFALRRDIIMTWGHTHKKTERAQFAALGACWVGPGLESVKIESFSYDLLDYGGNVYDAFRESGATAVEIAALSTVAFALVMSEVPIVDTEVQAAENFTDPPPAV